MTTLFGRRDNLRGFAKFREKQIVKKLALQLKKKSPFASIEQEVVISLLRTNELFQHRFGKLFRQYDLTQPQYNILRILAGEGDRLPSLEIASRMITIVPAITGLIDKLEAKELVQREPCEQDRRVCYVRLTKKGAKLIEQMHEPNLAMHKSLVGHLSNTEAEQLLQLLERTRTAVEQCNL